MAMTVDKKKCAGCGFCVDICPQDGVRLDENMIAIIDEEACIECGECEYECPALAISLKDGAQAALG